VYVSNKRPPVYSTDPARAKRCKRCGRYPCRCQLRGSRPPDQQEAHIRRETKGRGGKTVTAVRNLDLTPADLKALSKHLKRACGTGGTAKNGVVEIQGDHREKVAEVLRGMGYKTKFTGG
jgi:translation initiation factor 1